jgi:protein-disulfide isomerase
MKKLTVLLTVPLILMFLSFCYAATDQQEKESEKAVAPEVTAVVEQESELKAFDLEGLSEEQIEMLKTFLSENRMKVCYSKPILDFLDEDPPNLIAKQVTQNTINSIKGGQDNRATTLQLKRYLRRAKSAPDRSPETVYDINITNSPFRGAEKADVTIVEFSDFQCPYCAKLYKNLDQVSEKYSDRVKHVFKNFPLERIHKAARLAAKAALAAGEQGKFWEMRNKLFDHYRTISKENILKYAEEMELDKEKFEQTLNNKDLDKLITEDLVEGELADVRGTPSVYINGRIYRGDRSAQGFDNYIRNLLGLPKEEAKPETPQ